MAWVYLEVCLLPLEIGHWLKHALGHNGNLRMSDPRTFAFLGDVQQQQQRFEFVFTCSHLSRYGHGNTTGAKQVVS